MIIKQFLICVTVVVRDGEGKQHRCTVRHKTVLLELKDDSVALDEAASTFAGKVLYEEQGVLGTSRHVAEVQSVTTSTL